MLSVLTSTVAPVFGIVLVGVWLRNRDILDPGALSRIALYALSPALIFSSIARSTVPVSELALVAAGVVSLMICLYVIGMVVGAVLTTTDEGRAAYLLSTVFMNSGNYGLPIILFAFGEDGFAIGVLYFVTQSFLTNTAGAYVASRGTAKPREALSNVLRVPALYAAALALPFPLLGVTPPEWLLRPVALLGQAAIPLLLLILGSQLTLHLRREHFQVSAGALATRLLLSPLLAAGLAWTLGFRTETAAVFVVQSAMPTAVFTIVLSLEFGADTDLLAGIVAYATLLSVMTLSILIPLVS